MSAAATVHTSAARRPQFFFRTGSTRTSFASPTPQTTSENRRTLAAKTLLINGILATFVVALVESFAAPLVLTLFDVPYTFHLLHLITALVTALALLAGPYGTFLTGISLIAASLVSRVYSLQEWALPTFMVVFVLAHTYASVAESSQGRGFTPVSSGRSWLSWFSFKHR